MYVRPYDDNVQHEDDCFEHGNPVTLLKFHGQSMRNIASKESQVIGSRRKGISPHVAFGYLLLFLAAAFISTF